jgi:hypothetical protein
LSYVFTANGLDNIIWRGSEKLRDDGELVHVVLSGEQRLSLQHFCEDAACAPNVYLDVVLLPREHDLRCSVVPCGDVAGHLGVLYTGESEIANLEIAVLVDENVTRLQITMDDTRRVHVFKTALMMSAELWRCVEDGLTRIW